MRFILIGLFASLFFVKTAGAQPAAVAGPVSYINAPVSSAQDAANQALSNVNRWANGVVGNPISVTGPGLGATCNGVVDDTAALNSMASNSRYIIPAGKVCVVNSANLSIPSGTVLEGGAAPSASWYGLTGITGIALNPSYTILMNNGSALKSLFIYRKGLLANPTASQAASAVSAWGNESSVAITYPANIAQLLLQDLFIEGFNTCMSFYAGNFTATHINGDCYNGAEVQSAGDNYYLDNVRFEPFYSLGTNSADSTHPWARPGIGFNLHDGDTGGVLTKDFTFMYRSGFVLNNVGGTQLVGNNAEWQSGIDGATSYTVGYRILTSTQVYSTANFANGFSIGQDIASVIYQSTGDSINPTYQSLLIEGVSSASQTIVYSGAPTVGDQIKATFTSSAVTGSPLTITYTVVSGDTPGSIATKMTRLINANQALIGASIWAQNSALNTILLYYPNADSLTISNSVVGTTVATQTSTTGFYGAAPFISSALLSVPNGGYGIYLNGQPSFGQIIGPDFSTYTLPANWLGQAGGDYTANITFSGVRWSSSPTLTSCGSGAHLAGGNNTDAGGTVQEGASVSSCTLNFYTSWPTATVSCIVSSRTGIPLTVSTLNATQLVITHSSQSAMNWDYRCSIGGIS